MFGIGAGEIFVIAVLLLIAVGPNRMPTLIRSVFKAYRQFRQATRDLRASTGIDEILQDEDLAAIRKPLMVPAAAKTEAAGKPPKKRALAYNDRVRELPPEGVDLDFARELETRPSEEEKQRLVAAKLAAAAPAQDDPIVRAKLAAARAKPGGETGDDSIRRAKLAAAGMVAEGETVSAKLAASGPDDEAILRAKLAPARRPEEDAIIQAKTAAARAPDEDAIRNAKLAAVAREDEDDEPDEKRAGKGG